MCAYINSKGEETVWRWRYKLPVKCIFVMSWKCGINLLIKQSVDKLANKRRLAHILGATHKDDSTTIQCTCKWQVSVPLT